MERLIFYFKYIQKMKSKYHKNKMIYFNNAYDSYDKIEKLMYKYPYLRKIDLSKYKLPESARYPKLDFIRYSR